MNRIDEKYIKGLEQAFEDLNCFVEDPNEVSFKSDKLVNLLQELEDYKNTKRLNTNDIVFSKDFLEIVKKLLKTVPLVTSKKIDFDHHKKELKSSFQNNALFIVWEGFQTLDKIDELITSQTDPLWVAYGIRYKEAKQRGELYNPFHRLPVHIDPSLESIVKENFRKQYIEKYLSKIEDLVACFGKITSIDRAYYHKVNESEGFGINTNLKSIILEKIYDATESHILTTKETFIEMLSGDDVLQSRLITKFSSQKIYTLARFITLATHENINLKNEVHSKIKIKDVCNLFLDFKSNPPKLDGSKNLFKDLHDKLNKITDLEISPTK